VEDVVSGSEIANIIGMLIYMYYDVISYVNLIDCREGNAEFQVVAEATWLLAHPTKLQPIHHLLQPRSRFGR
jgi:hypothetical protein